MPAEIDPEVYRSILEDLPAGLWLVNTTRQILLWSRGAEDLTGYLSQEVVGRDCASGLLSHCDGEGAALCGESCPLIHAMRDGGSCRIAAFMLHKDGSRIPVTLTARPVRNEDGGIVGAAALFEPRHSVAARPELHGVRLDPETRLPDHEGIVMLISAALEERAHTGEPLGILVFSIDGLDTVLHADGRHAVEALRLAIGHTLASNAWPGEMVGRWSTDLFLVILKRCDEAGLRTRAAQFQNIAGLAAAPWWGGRLAADVSAAGAIAIPGDSPLTLVQRAVGALRSLEGAKGFALAHAGSNQGD